MVLRMDVEDIMNKMIGLFEKDNIQKAYLFGSRARGDNKKNSDIDILVNAQCTFRQKRKLTEQLNYISGLLSVDVHFCDEVSEKFFNKVITEAKILYEKE